MRWISLSCIIAVSFFQGSALLAKAQNNEKIKFSIVEESKISSELHQAMLGGSAQIQVLVYLDSQADISGVEDLETREERGAYVYRQLVSHAAQSQEGLRAYLDAQGADYRPFYITNMIALYNPSRELVRALEQRDDVSQLSLDPNYEKDEVIEEDEALVNLSSFTGIEDSLSYIGADRVWDEFGVKGQGIVVASQDTGIQWDHPALIKQYRGYDLMAPNHDYNWRDAIQRRNNHSSRNSCGYAVEEPCDDGSHGTHTLGTVVGSDGRSNKIGVAPESKWIACRNMDDGDGRPSTYIDCFEFFLAPYPQNGDPFTDGRPDLAPHVINNSWGCPASEGCDGFEMEHVFEAMKAAGIMVVVSAGNDGPGCGTIDSQPSSHQGAVFTVGAYDHRWRNIARFSSRGPGAWDGLIGPDIVAPGVSIRSAVPRNRYQGGYSGTSMAGPHVAGLVALLWSAKPDLIGQIDETAEIIRNTARPLTTSSQSCGGVSGNEVPNNTYGAGVIDAYEAVSSQLQD